MGAALRREVERQLLVDLEHYRPDSAGAGLVIDWSNPCQEGHCTELLGGVLESMSDVAVRDSSGTVIAEGWIDFIHGGGALPLVVFWQFLDFLGDGRHRLTGSGIPAHIWANLSNESRAACAVDPAWSQDPSVLRWKQGGLTSRCT
jgi:hypothetical protein